MAELLGLRIGCGRHQDRHRVDVRHVVERVEGELQRLAAHEKTALLGGLALLDRAVLAESAHAVEDDVLVVEDRDVAVVCRVRTQRDDERDALDLRRPSGHGDGLLARREPVLGRDVVDDLLDRVAGTPSRLPGRPVRQLDRLRPVVAGEREQGRHERGDTDADEHAVYELEARGVGGVALDGPGGFRLLRCEDLLRQDVGLALGAMGRTRRVRREQRLARVWQERVGIVSGLRARRVLRALARVRTGALLLARAVVVEEAHAATLGHSSSSSRSISGADRFAASSTSVTSSPYSSRRSMSVSATLATPSRLWRMQANAVM